MSDLNFTHRFVVPRNPSGRTFLLLHGTGGNENDLLSLGRDLDPSAALLSPRGKVLENGMPRFFRRLAEGVFDEEDVIGRANELADFVDAATTRYQLDPKQLGAVGFSNGANIAAAMLLLRPELLSFAILFRPMVPLVPESLPDLGRLRIFISAGERDPIVPLENVKRLMAMFQAAGAEACLRLEPTGHGLALGDVDAAKDWLKNVG